MNNIALLASLVCYLDEGNTEWMMMVKKIKSPFWLCLCCCLISILGFRQHANCQDISSPRFFTFNIQSLNTQRSPVLPQNSAFIPNDLESDFQYEFALRLPFKLKGNTRLLGEVSHAKEFSFGLFSFKDNLSDDLKPLDLYESSFSFIIQHKFNENWKFTSVMNARTNSNQSFDFSRRALRYSNLSMVEKSVKGGSIGLGSIVSVNQRVTILPLVKYEVQLNKKWGIDILFPSHVLGTRQLSKSSRLLFGARGSAASYLLGNTNDLKQEFVGANLRRVDINGIIGFEKQITPILGLSVEAGATFPFRSGIFDFQDPSLNLHNFRTRPNPHLNFGLFLSLPR